MNILAWDEKYTIAIKELIELVKNSAAKTPDEINKLKYLVAKKYGLNRIPSNVEIVKFLRDMKESTDLIKYFVLKPVRSISGVVIVAIMTAPYECPHGRCLYCPHYPNVPISYTGKEPSAMRALQNELDPYKQVIARLKQLEAMGHVTDKVEVVIQGGTFNTTPLEYREWYMKRLLQAFIGYLPGSFEEGARAAENAKRRIVGVTFETRPDACSEEQIDWMLERGGTRVELGVQTIYDDVYDYVNRGHTTYDVIEATRRLKDAGFKVTYHLMPGLPLVSIKHDIEVFNKVFSNPHYLPDSLKIYPTLVLEYTGLIKLYRDGLYTPIKDDDAVSLISSIKWNFIPKWVRIMRINRDISTKEIIDGVKKSNLREIVQREMKRVGFKCRCIRCREVGHKYLKGEHTAKDVTLTLTTYHASDGLEIFIAAEDPETDTIFGFIRVRRPSQKAWRPEITCKETFIVRELHVYGKAIPLAHTSDEISVWQHKGIGSLLLKKAEEIVSSYGGEKVVVISGIGVRQYYYMHGYSRDGPYCSKLLI
ncbi:MAG: tRNA uridine(34) 5-carboxymethylaminomethyl modification radical SAM/GNAT enzyme Elp3 [Candidatus Geothermarchaeota archaeon]